MMTDHQPYQPAPGRVVVLFGSKAGVGTSVVATNLAIALHTLTTEPVVLLEAHYDFGNQAALLALAPERHLGHALAGSLADGLIADDSGIAVLLRSPAGYAPTLDQLRGLLRQARARARYVIVDSASRYDPVFHTLLDEAECVLMVTTPEATALRHAERLQQQAASWGVAAKLHVVVNRWESEAGVQPAQLQALFGDRLVGRLPSAGRLAVEAANSGRPFVLTAVDHPLSQAVNALAAWLRGQAPAEQARP